MAKTIIGVNDDVTIYAKLAAAHGMTYGQLQQLETLGKVKVINNKLYRVKEDGTYEPY